MAKQSKLRVCKNCNNPLPEKATVCPSCGAKNKKPIYKRWWFWLIAALIVIGVASSSGMKSDPSDKQPSSTTVSSEIETGVTSEIETGVTSEDVFSDETEEVPSSEPSEIDVPSNEVDLSVNEETDLIDGMRPDFKKAMDSYEDFFDEYVAFMKKYAASDGSDLTLLTDYVAYMSKYADMMADLEAWDSTDMNTAETAYYIEVQSRINQKLLEVAG